jgi:hypothetical protein
MGTDELRDRLAAVALAAGGHGDPVVLSNRPSPDRNPMGQSGAGGAGGPRALVVRVGDVVVKAHPAGTDPSALAARLLLAASGTLDPVLLPPLAIGPVDGAGPGSTAPRPSERFLGAGPPRAPGPDPASPPGDLLAGLAVRVGDRLVTAWPAGRPVARRNPDAAPWEAGAELLARLHATPLEALAQPVGLGPSALRGPGPGADQRSGPTLPAAGGPARVGRVLGRLAEAGGGAAGAVVHRAAATLPAWALGAGQAPGAGALTHGDWHMGQLVHRPRSGWRLVDVDDLGLGDPAWDLARPAAWYGAGLLPAEVWLRFLRAYQAAGGCAVPAGDDPWAVLEVPARALLVQSAAAAVTGTARDGQAPRPLDEVEQALVDACGRIARSVRP